MKKKAELRYHQRYRRKALNSFFIEQGTMEPSEFIGAYQILEATDQNIMEVSKELLT